MFLSTSTSSTHPLSISISPPSQSQSHTLSPSSIYNNNSNTTSHHSFGVTSAFRSKFSRKRSRYNTSITSNATTTSRAEGEEGNVLISSFATNSVTPTNNNPTTTNTSLPPVTTTTELESSRSIVTHQSSEYIQAEPLQVGPNLSSNSTSDQDSNSMRRRATSTILIPQSIRSVFRDNNTTSEDTTATQQASSQQDTPIASEPSSPMTRRPTLNPTGSSSGGIATSSRTTSGNTTDMPSIKFIPHQDIRAARPSLAFAPMTRTLPDGSSIIRVGRYSERDLSPNANNGPSSAPIGFKSKVVSRRHCEFWFSNGQWFVKDVKSSSGTFLNHIRLSQPSTESKPFPVNDGDIIQLGMDFRGGEESIFRCVKIRVEVNRGWQRKINDFNTTTHKTLKALAKNSAPNTSTECSICLMSIAPCQALFVAPCSHVWHYKCIRPVISNPKTYPQFLCPNCRAVADLEADIDESIDGWDDSELIGNDNAQSGSQENRPGTPVNANNTGEIDENSNGSDEMVVEHQEAPSTIVTPQDSMPPPVINRPDVSNDVQDATMNMFPETQPITIRDPRSTLSDPLEGVVTPRNEAGPFVFDGTGRRIPATASEAPA